MRHYHHLTTEERENLLVLTAQGKGVREIARSLNRSASTISREIKRNSTKKGYSALAAEKQYQKRRKKSKRKKRMEEEQTKTKVEKLLNTYWSPEQICERLKKEHAKVQIGTSTIYRALASGELAPEFRRKLRRTFYKHRKKKGSGHLNIDYTIHDRPKSVESRIQFGHWESDTVRGFKSSGCVATHVERKSRFTVALKIPNRTTKPFIDSAIGFFSQLPKSRCRSFTVDHGKEFADHRRLSQALGCKVYFADPAAPYQRGTNENTNGLLRQFLPKGSDFSSLTQDILDSFVSLLNCRPRKCLGWKSPYEVYFHKVLHLT